MVQDVAKNLNEVFEKNYWKKIIFRFIRQNKRKHIPFSPEFTQDGTQTGFTKH